MLSLFFVIFFLLFFFFQFDFSSFSPFFFFFFFFSSFFFPFLFFSFFSFFSFSPFPSSFFFFSTFPSKTFRHAPFPSKQRRCTLQHNQEVCTTCTLIVVGRLMIPVSGTESRRSSCGIFHYCDSYVIPFYPPNKGVYHAYVDRRGTPDDYLLAGRNQGVLPVALSITATHISAITTLGFPTEVFHTVKLSSNSFIVFLLFSLRLILSNASTIKWRKDIMTMLS